MIDPRATCIGIAALCGVLLSGVALGRFVTGNTHVSWYASGGAGEATDGDANVGNPDAAYPESQGYDFTASPVARIVCKGCGPGINERLQGSFAMGYDDAVVRDYMAREPRYRPDPAAYDPEPLLTESVHDAGPLSHSLPLEPAGQRAAPTVQPQSVPAPSLAPVEPATAG